MSTGPCVPAALYAAAPNPARTTSSVKTKVYLDGSLSMAGYLDAQTSEMRMHGDLLALLPAGSQFFSFGNAIHPLGKDQSQAFAYPAAYRCKGRPGCDNQDSRIDLVLQDIQQHGQYSLNIVVTDLWLSGGSIVGSPQVALGEPLSAILTQGMAVGVVGVRAPYSGPVYDIPGIGIYQGAKERPIFALLIGPEAQVKAFIDRMAKSGSPAFGPDRMHSSLFAKAPASAWSAGDATPLQVKGLGVASGQVTSSARMQPVRQYRLELNRAQAGAGSIEGTFNLDTDSVAGLVWQGPLSASTRVWLLKDEGALDGDCKSAWQESQALDHAWTQDGQFGAKFKLTPKSGSALTAGRTYLVAGYAGTKSLVRPNPASHWMRDWSLSASDVPVATRAHPTFFKVLNLGDIANIMEQSLQSVTPQGQTVAATAFLVKVSN